MIALQMGGKSGMPFARYKSTFGPETLRALQEAFDMAWSDIALIPIVSTDPDAARELLAQRIVAIAEKEGELDPERLRRKALRAFEP